MVTEKVPLRRRLAEWIRRRLRKASALESFERSAADRFAPAFAVRETAGAFMVTADLPGIDEKDVEISLVGNRLIVSGNRVQEKEEQGELVYAWQRSSAAFVRSFVLPKESDTEQIDGGMADGVLTLTVRKTTGASTRKIELKVVERRWEGKDAIELP